MIALQARGPQLPDLSRQTAQYANMMNMARQSEAAQRQAQQAQQAMDIGKAQEARAVELHGPALAEAGSKAALADLKTGVEFNAYVYMALKNANSPEQVAGFARRIADAPQFQTPLYQGTLSDAVASMPADPAQFDVWRKQTGIKALTAAQQMEQEYIKQTTGTEERLISVPKFGDGGATEVAGSRIQVAPGMTYVRGADGAVYPMPSKSGGGFDTPAPAVGVPPTAGAPGRGNTADVVYGFGEFGSPSKPLSTLSIGEVQDFQRNTLIPKTRGQIGKGPRIGTGAVGTYQITYGTLQDYAPKVLGSNWRNATFTADVQEQIAKAIYEDVKGENLKDTWAGLPSNRPGQYTNVPWEQVRDQIIQVESAGGPRGGAGAGVPATPPGAPIPLIPGKPPAPKKGDITPEKRLARDTAVQDLYDAVVEAEKKGHLVSEKQSYVANRAIELRRDRTYVPGGTAQKTSVDNIEANAAQLLRQIIQEGTSGTLNAVAEQKLFLKGVGGADATYETRLRTIRNFAKQNGIKLNEAGTAKPKAQTPKSATPVTKAPPGVSAAEWKEMTPAERKLWQ
jgi:hypothetical protein